ncbi:ubiquitin carboxyl-terminal hydrolase puf-like isoform X1 [Polyodon spathula]|uniref:ubiquitin carboxyl-terminal hydrolase puf-like isoform X1 n=1 Tax=Polyodon spathula TaxID=7913 RepID=UPI001B7E7CF0|nr:ubiquitin carboxyl-terminal hydrolase puf-like isoform X1 [Polyodon spathula]
MSKLKKFASIPGNSKMDTGYCGLINQGATCYLNTVLQTFFMTPEFRDAVHKYREPDKDKEKNLLFHLKKMFQNLEDKKCKVETTGVTRSLGMMDSDVWVQQDVAEFFRKILNEVSNESPVSENYQSTVINSTKCLKCETEASDNNRYLDISLPLNTSDHSTCITYSLENGLRDFLKSELLEGDNQSYCDKCKMKTDTETRYYFQSLPRILTLHLKRFQFDYYHMRFMKIQGPVEIPLELQFQKAPTANTEWCFSATIQQSTPQEKLYESNKIKKEMAPADIQKYMLKMKRSQQVGHNNSVTPLKKHGKKSCSTAIDIRKKDCLRYELFAICDHSGGYRGGHYTARIKSFENGKWYTFNDSFVDEYLMEQATGFRQSVTEGKVPCISSSTASLLMYRMSETSKPVDEWEPEGSKQHRNPEWEPEGSKQYRNPEWKPEGSKQQRNPEWEPEGPKQHRNPEWKPEGSKQQRNPEWEPEGLKQHRNPEWKPEGSKQHRDPEWKPEGSKQHRNPEWEPEGSKQHRNPEWKPEGSKQHRNPEWEPEGSKQHRNPEWKPEGSKQHRNPEWKPEGSKQYRNPEWKSEGSKQHRNPEWKPEGPKQHRNPDWKPEGSKQHRNPDWKPEGSKQYRNPEWKSEGSKQHRNPEWKPEGSKQQRNPEWEPEGSKQHRNPEWKPEGPKQHRNPEWKPEGPKQHRNPEWKPEGPKQHRNPEWKPEGPKQHRNPEWKPEGSKQYRNPEWKTEGSKQHRNPEWKPEGPKQHRNPEWEPEGSKQQRNPEWKPEGSKQHRNPEWKPEGSKQQRNPEWEPEGPK